MTINCLIGRGDRAIAEVGRPPAQETIESRTNLQPCARVARPQQVADFPLDPPHAFLGRGRPQIPTTTISKVAWAEGVAKEIEAFASSVFQRSFRLVDRQPELRHHRRRPRQRLRRVSAAEDDEVVGVIDDVGAESLAASAATPMLEHGLKLLARQGSVQDHPPDLARRETCLLRHGDNVELLAQAPGDALAAFELRQALSRDLALLRGVGGRAFGFFELRLRRGDQALVAFGRRGFRKRFM